MPPADAESADIGESGQDPLGELLGELNWMPCPTSAGLVPNRLQASAYRAASSSVFLQALEPFRHRNDRHAQAALLALVPGGADAQPRPATRQARQGW